jgi:hypothetical protein
MSNEVAVVAKSTTQQVATQPTRSLQHLASRMFNRSNHADSDAAAATSTEIAAYHATIAKWAEREHAELVTRLPADAIADAHSMYKAFATPQLTAWIAQNGIGHNLWVHDFLARQWRHLTSVEKELVAARATIAALKSGRR